MQSRYFTVQEVVPGVYAALAVPGQGAWSNARFVDLGKGILVFDTVFTPGAGRDLRRVAEAVTGKPVPWVVNSHRDYDHYLGNQAFSDVDIIGRRKTREVTARRTPAFLDRVRTQHASFLQELRGRIAGETDPLHRQELTQECGEHAALAATRDELVRDPGVGRGQQAGARALPRLEGGRSAGIQPRVRAPFRRLTRGLPRSPTTR